MAQHPRANSYGYDLAEFERERTRHMALLGLGQRAIKHPGLAVMVGEGFRPNSQLRPLGLDGDSDETSFWIFARARRIDGVRFIIRPAGGDGHLHESVALEIAHWALRLVDRD